MAFNFAGSPWESCSAGIRRKIEENSSILIREPGEHFYRDGESANGVYWIQSGIVLLYNLNPDGSHVGALPCYRGLLGAPAVLSGSYKANLKAVHACSARFTPFPVLTELMQDPVFGRLMGNYTTEDFTVMLSLWGSVTQQDSRTKLLDFLHSVFRHATPPAEEPVQSLPWPFSLTEMADWLSLSRPYLSKLVNGLINNGEISLHEGKLTINSRS